MDLAQVVGGNVQRLRTAAGTTLADLAATADISKTTLHGIEQGQANPTLSTLWALATALHVPLGELLEPAVTAVEVVRAGDQPALAGEAVSARLAHRVRVRGMVEIYDLEVGVREQVSRAHAAGVAECLVVTGGRVSAGPVEGVVELGVGDSVRFAGDVPHVYRGHTGADRAVLVMVYPEA
ncbi:helix-turn-helix domain-containing protein [Crossiella cryophila]|uniref:Transcriptional regulator with XRE-family HTH domain n=1 Tax=Crossiella cryophila TaxID=43355 RepID=A0A7W7CEJ2_9PSEU|nr:XRE family transcriptional regulator [Crossiella cryophila]MBB4678436.1 transcriptional regulator with XRE-family HTH domain [Crossiella cryophila]